MHRKNRWSLLLLGLACAGTHFAADAESVPYWGARVSAPIDTPIDQLKHGEFLWLGDAVSSGPLVMVVSITEQRGYVYRNGVLIGATSVSTGRPGYPTPIGVFTVLQKQVEHRSTIYDDAQMPYMERLTWGGVALHAGGLPGYPESHGCIHLPSEFAKRLFGITSTGMTVVIANETSEPQRVAHPGYLAPISVDGKPIERTPFEPTEEERWHPELSPTGPISIVISQGSQRVVVCRNGVEIGRARLSVNGAEPLASHALILTEGPSSSADPDFPDLSKYRWQRVDVPGRFGEAGLQVDPAELARIRLPATFVAHINSILSPGATVLVTNERLSPQTTGAPAKVMDADPPDARRASDR